MSFEKGHFYEKELNVALQAAAKGREVLLHHFGKVLHVETKYQAGLVSEADRSAEKAIRTHLESAFPDYDFLGEEEAYGKTNLSEPRSQKPIWVVDPLDGTTNFIHGFPIFCVSIGLVVGERPVVGVIDLPILNRTYYGSQGAGAYVDGSRLQVSQTNRLDHCLAATGFNNEKENVLQEQLQIFEKLVRRTRGIRRPGAAAFDLCMVASGAFDYFWEQNLSPWDVAAGQLLVEEAGGRVSTFDGGLYHPWKENLVASNSIVHEEIVKIITTTES